MSSSLTVVARADCRRSGHTLALLKPKCGLHPHPLPIIPVRYTAGVLLLLHRKYQPLPTIAMLIDSHHHLWKYSRDQYGWIDDQMAVLKQDFLVPELQQVAADSGLLRKQRKALHGHCAGKFSVVSSTSARLLGERERARLTGEM